MKSHWVIRVQAIIKRIRKIGADEIADVLDVIGRFWGVNFGLGVVLARFWGVTIGLDVVVTLSCADENGFSEFQVALCKIHTFPKQ